MHTVYLYHNYSYYFTIYYFCLFSQGLVALVEVFPDKVVPKLCAEFIGLQSSATKERTVETRLKIGEALVKATRCLGKSKGKSVQNKMNFQRSEHLNMTMFV